MEERSFSPLLSGLNYLVIAQCAQSEIMLNSISNEALLNFEGVLFSLCFALMSEWSLDGIVEVIKPPQYLGSADLSEPLCAGGIRIRGH